MGDGASHSPSPSAGTLLHRCPFSSSCATLVLVQRGWDGDPSLTDRRQRAMAAHCMTADARTAAHNVRARRPTACSSPCSTWKESAVYIIRASRPPTSCAMRRLDLFRRLASQAGEEVFRRVLRTRTHAPAPRSDDQTWIHIPSPTACGSTEHLGMRRA